MLFIPAGKLVAPVAESQATGKMNIVGLTGRVGVRVCVRVNCYC